MTSRTRRTSSSRRRTAAPSRRGEFNVFVTRIGDEPTVHRMRVGATVKDCLGRAGINGGAKDIRLDARPTTLNTRVRKDQVISIVGQVEGGGGL